MKRTAAALVLAAAATACAHKQPAPAVQQPKAPLDLPASFGGTHASLGAADLVLLDPDRYVLAWRSGDQIEFRRGEWKREGERVALDPAQPGDLTVLEGGDRLGTLQRQLLPRLLAGTVERRTSGLAFTPCEDGEPVPLIDTTGLLERQDQTPFFAAFLGSARVDETIAWDLQRAGTGEGANCSQMFPDFVARAQGHEPSWTLEIDTRSVRLMRPDAEPVGAPWAPFRWENGAYRYRADTGAEKWDIAITPGACEDTMVEVTFGYRAELRVNDQRYAGCAQLGTEWEQLFGT